MADTNGDYDLKTLRKINSELKEKLKDHKKYLDKFKHPKGGYFFREEKKDINLTSTITCVTSLINADKAEKCEIDKIIKNIFEKEQWSSAKLNDGKDNCYTVPMVLTGLSKLLNRPIDPVKQERIKKYLAKIHEKIKRDSGLRIKQYPVNAFLTYLGLRSYEEYYSKDTTINELKEGIKGLKNELHRQITLFSANVEYEKDIFQLGYSLVALLRYDMDISAPIISKAFSIFFGDQKDDGSWDKYNPVFNYPEVGSAYCYQFEFLRELLYYHKDYYNIFIKYIDKLERTRQWTKNHEMVNKTDKKLCGWCSYHYTDWRDPTSWPTACVFSFLRLYNEFIENVIRKTVLEQYDSKKVSENYWEEEIKDSELHLKENYKPSLKEFITQKIIDPINNEEDINAYGILLFGPPGTGKTSYAKAIAQKLDWPLISLDPSHFLLEGFSGIVRNANSIFKKLGYLEKVVVLFDEMDELIKKRTNEYEYETRIFTTSMLPLISKLHEKKNFIYIFNTNFYDEIDPAIKRAGRFDFHLFVGPPNIEKKKIIIKNELKKKNISDDLIDKIIQVINSLKNPDNSKKLEYFLFFEILNLCTEFSNITEEDSATDILEEIKRKFNNSYNLTYAVNNQGKEKFDDERKKSIINTRLSQN